MVDFIKSAQPHPEETPKQNPYKLGGGTMQNLTPTLRLQLTRSCMTWMRYLIRHKLCWSSISHPTRKMLKHYGNLDISIADKEISYLQREFDIWQILKICGIFVAVRLSNPYGRGDLASTRSTKSHFYQTHVLYKVLT